MYVYVSMIYEGSSGASHPCGLINNCFSSRSDIVDSEAEWGLNKSMLKSPNTSTLFLLPSEMLPTIVINSSYHAYVAAGILYIYTQQTRAVTENS